MKNLYLVEFGKPSPKDTWIIFSGSAQEPLHVIARSYDEAAKKAIEYVYANADRQSIITSDGSLKLEEEELRVKSVKLVADIIVW